MFDPAFTLSSYSMSGAAHGDWKHEWPQNLVMFGALLEEPNVRQILMEKGYVQVWYGINGWEEDERRRGGVVVWKWGSSQ
jgi:phosphatidylinositol glycan class B